MTAVERALGVWLAGRSVPDARRVPDVPDGATAARCAEVWRAARDVADRVRAQDLTFAEGVERLRRPDVSGDTAARVLAAALYETLW